MFRNCGKALKTMALIFFILCIATAFILLIAEFADMRSYLFDSLGLIIIVLLVLVASAFVGSQMIYGFGEIVDCVKEIRDQAKK